MNLHGFWKPHKAKAHKGVLAKLAADAANAKAMKVAKPNCAVPNVMTLAFAKATIH